MLLAEVLSETLIMPFLVNSEQPQTSAIQIQKLKGLELENCKSSQSLSPLTNKPSSVFAKNILLPNQNGQNPPFRDAKRKAKSFVKDVLIAAHGMTEQTYQDLELIQAEETELRNGMKHLSKKLNKHIQDLRNLLPLLDWSPWDPVWMIQKQFLPLRPIF